MGLWLRSLLKEISISNNTQLESNVGSNNTAVKRWACTWGSILAGRAQISLKISKGDVRQNRCPLEETKRIEKLLEICNRKQRQGKKTLRHLAPKAYPSKHHDFVRRRLTAMLAPTSIDRLMTYRERFLATETNRTKLILFQFKKLSVVWPVILVFGLLPFFFHRLSKLLFS